MSMQTLFDGPLIAAGNMLAFSPFSPNANPEAGPSAFFEGTAIPIVFGQPIPKDGSQVGRVLGLYDSAAIVVIDAIPQTLGAAAIAAAQAVAAAGNLTLVSTRTKAICDGISVIDPNTSVQRTGLCIDPGFTTGSTTAASVSVTIPAGTFDQFFPNQWICIGGAGAGNTAHYCRVVSAVGTTLTITPAAVTTISNAPILTANKFDLTGVDYDVAPSSVTPFLAAGLLRLLDPAQTLARTLQCVSTNAGDTTQVLTVTGADIYGQTQVETLALNGTTVVNGQKAFKHIFTIAVSAACAGNVSVGTTDVFGFPTRIDRFEDSTIFMNATLITASTGFVAPDKTSPATVTTDDVRGTYAVQTASNGSRRLTVKHFVPGRQMLTLGVGTMQGLLGVTPV
jgi:hypothetical protein